MVYDVTVVKMRAYEGFVHLVKCLQGQVIRKMFENSDILLRLGYFFIEMLFEGKTRVKD